MPLLPANRVYYFLTLPKEGRRRVMPRGMAEIERRMSNTSLVDFRLPVNAKETQGYLDTRLDPRDQRAIVAFDGDFLPGTLMKSIELLIVSRGIRLLEIPLKDLYAEKSLAVEGDDYVVYRDRKSGELMAQKEIYRHIMLLRAGKYIFQFYDQENLWPRQCLIQVKSSPSELGYYRLVPEFITV